MIRAEDSKLDYSNLEGYGAVEQKVQEEVIYTPDQPENAAFYLKEGFVRLVHLEQGTTKVVGPGDFFGDRSIFYSKNIYTEALSNIEYIRIDDQSFSQLLHNEAKLAVEIINRLSKHHKYLSEKQNLLSHTKEILTHLRGGHSLKLLIINWKKNKDRPICWNY